ncbi:hypothetical protein E2C01_020282 [Portunus trituberculatus]|uniref:Uncharacterized protein n=1 Tax=Portunus trituberculatus TaxID=210409 RepID=A0A5B7DZQ0_PORTR|nr:hypothetical protein [Portunus trituberculatus]
MGSQAPWGDNGEESSNESVPKVKTVHEVTNRWLCPGGQKTSLMRLQERELLTLFLGCTSSTQ